MHVVIRKAKMVYLDRGQEQKFNRLYNDANKVKKITQSTFLAQLIEKEYERSYSHLMKD